MDMSTLIAVIFTVIAFAAGLFVGWLWWGRRFFTTRLTRDEALAVVQERLERERQGQDDGPGYWDVTDGGRR